MFPGLTAPKVSCVIFPMAPTGVVSVSPVTRQATSARAKERTTARSVCQYGIPKVRCPRIASPAKPSPWPRKNQEGGVSMAFSGSSAFLPPRNMSPMPLNARTALRHCMPKASSPDVTMQAVPPQSVQLTMLR